MSEKPGRDDVLKSMDDAALIAEAEYNVIREKYPEAVKELDTFMKKHYLQTGYKRLARIIMRKEV